MREKTHQDRRTCGGQAKSAGIKAVHFVNLTPKLSRLCLEVWEELQSDHGLSAYFA